MNTPIQAAQSANKTIMPVFSGSQAENLQRKLAFVQAEFKTLLNCHTERVDECRRLKKKVRSLEKLVAELVAK